MSKFRSRKEKHEHRLRQEAERRKQRMKDKEELVDCRKNHPKDRVGISGIISVTTVEGYAGISRATCKEYDDIPWHTGEFVTSEIMPTLYDMPSAIKRLDESTPRVRDRVLQDYADWKMQNDCGQHPWDLAIFLRISIAKAEFMFRIYDAFIGRLQ